MHCLTIVVVLCMPLLIAAWVSMSSRYGHTCGILRSSNLQYQDTVGQPYGPVQCWGTVTDGVTNIVTVPNGAGSIGTGTTWRSVETGAFHTCVLSSQNTSSYLRCWGSNRNGQTTVPNPNTATWSSMSLGREHTCGILTNGQMLCWGLNDFGQTTVPNQATALWSSVSAGWFFTCGILESSGLLRCWGDNTNGQRNIPNDVVDSQWSMVSAGRFHTCGVLASSGQVRCWGATGTHWSATNVDVNQAIVPAELASASFSSISASGDGWHTCGILSTGQTRCWGLNTSGQATVPAAVTTTGLTQISAGFVQTCGLLKGPGIMQCWGSNGLGALNIPVS
jgi:hypothetical protein